MSKLIAIWGPPNTGKTTLAVKLSALLHEQEVPRPEAGMEDMGKLSKEAAEEGYCSMTKHILLMLFTFGVWYYIWTYRTTKFLNRAPETKQYNPLNQLLLCAFVPFYAVFWLYKHGQRFDAMNAKNEQAKSDTAILCLILGIFVPIAAYIILQNRINNLCGGPKKQQEKPEAALWDIPEDMPAVFSPEMRIYTVFTDNVTPAISTVFPLKKSSEVFSVGTALSKAEITQQDIDTCTVTSADKPNIGFLGYKDTENHYTYPFADELKCMELLALLQDKADVVIVDCMSVPDKLSEVALKKADMVLQVVSPDLKSIAFCSSQLPLLADPAYHSEKHLVVLNEVTNDVYAPVEEAANHFRKPAFHMTYSREIREQTIRGELLTPIHDKKYNLALGMIVQRIMSTLNSMTELPEYEMDHDELNQDDNILNDDILDNNMLDREMPTSTEETFQASVNYDDTSDDTEEPFLNLD